MSFTTRRSRQLVPVAAVLALVLMSACSGDPEVPTASAPSSPVVVDQEDQVQGDDNDVVVDDQDDVKVDDEEPVEIDVTALEVGDNVPAEMIKEAKEAGANLYVTFEGDAEVVERGTLPQSVRDDLISAASPDGYLQSQADAAGKAARNAGVSMVLVHKAGVPVGMLLSWRMALRRHPLGFCLMRRKQSLLVNGSPGRRPGSLIE